MEPNNPEAERYYQAQKKVKEIREFYQHLTVFLLCNPIVIAVNLMTSSGYLYFWYSLLGWGVAIILHGLKAFDRFPFFSKEWEKRKIDEILEKENNKQKWE
ncbi:2TM domain-containing protein [Flavobacterium sp. LM4]|uniref:2TM domain-containing protein n=1 Tax=Flavobacterium sp. LM4 TaxID=1938609 RepID=UPI000991E1C4|nr:2TM domain-containing protein [Flavobacterium sp. LM4]OOV18855.1 histidine kinase [Flavobacterium sp. LM4]